MDAAGSRNRSPAGSRTVVSGGHDKLLDDDVHDQHILDQHDFDQHDFDQHDFDEHDFDEQHFLNDNAARFRSTSFINNHYVFDYHNDA